MKNIKEMINIYKIKTINKVKVIEEIYTKKINKTK